jgi:propionate CoA-transferase
LKIIKEGETRKFVDVVEQRSFSGEHVFKRGQQVLYVTERCVFRLIETGLELIEIAPGIDLERDIMSQMNFRPAISPKLSPMDPRIFRDESMGIYDDMQVIPQTEKIRISEK